MIKANVVIIVSEQDEAGMNIAEFIRENCPLENASNVKIPPNWPLGNYQLQYNAENTIALFTMSPYHFQADFLSDFFNAKLVIFASKHLSKAKQKAILVHPLGNWSQAKHESGMDNTLSITSSWALTKGYFALKKHKEQEDLTDYWVGVEATHHGPTQLTAPSIFIEVGGTIDEWTDLDACKVVALSILDIANEYVNNSITENLPAIIGIGGGHYAPSFIKRIEAEMFLFGHIMPKYFMEDVTKYMLQQAWEKTLAKDKLFLIDKKGSKGKDRQRIISLLEELGYPHDLTTNYSVSQKFNS
ncbi:MAG: hypothetical protein GPJ54_09780 [Candidatus Heimdallarchaeota archaeon]|nr:hypothetical protein [Candidatus Heimdallarchaeota archaeon]